MKTLLVFAGVLALLRLVRPLTILNQLLRLRFWKPSARLVTEDEAPAYVREGLREPMSELQSLGFQLVGWMALGDERPQGGAPRFCARLFHAETRAYADVAFALAPDPVAPWMVTFSTYGADRVVRTFPGERSFLGEPSGTIALEPFAPTIALQWDAHRAGVRDSGVVPADVDHEANFARSFERQAAWFASLVRDGALMPAADSAYVLSWRVALSRYRGLQRARQRILAQRAARAGSLKPIAMVPIEEELAAYARHVEQTSGPPRASFLALLFAVSVALFIAAGAYVMGAATTAIIVVGVVLFHELGHYLAMRAFGYVDTTIFFVPFLGGVATGRKDDATFAQRMIVLLAGPLPGLLLAIVVALVSRRAWPHDALFILAGVNLFNLLPILPLDGGQIAHLLFFARRPWLDVASRAVAGVALLLMGFVAPAGVFFAVLGIITLVQLPQARRRAGLQRRFREARVRWPDAPPAALFFRMLRASPQAAAPFVQKLVLARLTLPGADADVRVKWGSLFGWLCSYLAVLVVGCVAVALTFSSAFDAPLAARKAVEPVPVASLSCSMLTGDPPEHTESSSSPAMVLGGVATFASREALAAARPAVVAAAPNAASRDFGVALLVWTKLFDDDDDDSEVGDVLKARALRMSRTAAAVTTAGGRFHDLGSGPPGVVAVDCTAGDEPAAQAIDDHLADYTASLRNDMPIPAPWTSTDEPTEAQQLARRTFRIAMTAATDRTHDEPMRLSTFWGLLAGGNKAVKSHVQKRNEQRAQQAEAALAAERARRPIDEEVARLVVTKIATISIDERERVTAELRSRLGASEPRTLPNVAFALKSSHAGSRLRVEIGHVNPKQFDSTVRPMLSWLCARSCVDPRLLVGAR